jgi:hypothetical protein
MNTPVNTHNSISPQQLAVLGEGRIAYVKPMLSEDVSRAFPQAPKIQPGLHLFGLFAADGSPILITDSREAALVNARDNDLQMVSLH